MREMFIRYGNELVLLDATYKPTKYTLPPFFLVVKTNVNFQVCAVIVLQEASSDSSNDISVTKIDNFTFSVTGFEAGQRVRKNYRTFLDTKINFAPAIATTLSNTECFANIFLLCFSLD